jgi:hypothetical protein
MKIHVEVLGLPMVSDVIGEKKLDGDNLIFMPFLAGG